jgi:hypothetical protein
MQKCFGASSWQDFWTVLFVRKYFIGTQFENSVDINRLQILCVFIGRIKLRAQYFQLGTLSPNYRTQ